jgi:hypothetical protein
MTGAAIHAPFQAMIVDPDELDGFGSDDKNGAWGAT